MTSSDRLSISSSSVSSLLLFCIRNAESGDGASPLCVREVSASEDLPRLPDARSVRASCVYRISESIYDILAIDDGAHYVQPFPKPFVRRKENLL